MADLTVALVGLGRVGASIGLALKRYNDTKGAANHFTVRGYDPVGRVERLAKQMEAVDEIASGPGSVAQDADAVVFAPPYATARQTLVDVAPALRPGAVVFDLSPIKHRTGSWAKDLMPEDAYWVGVTPVVNPAYLWDGVDDIEHASVDLFDGGAFVVTPDAQAHPDAIDLASAVFKLVGGAVHFMDPVEHDGLAAANEGLPAVMSVAAFRAMAYHNGWAERQRLTNPAFARATHRVMDRHPDDLRDLILHNADNTVIQIDRLLAELTALRDVVATGDEDALEAALVDTEARYQAWLRRRSQGKWDDAFEDMPDRSAGVSNLLSGFMGGYIANRLMGKRDDDDK